MKVSHFRYGYPHTCYRRERRSVWPRVLVPAISCALWAVLIAVWNLMADQQLSMW